MKGGTYLVPPRKRQGREFRSEFQATRETNPDSEKLAR